VSVSSRLAIAVLMSTSPCTNAVQVCGGRRVEVCARPAGHVRRGRQCEQRAGGAGVRAREPGQPLGLRPSAVAAIQVGASGKVIRMQCGLICDCPHMEVMPHDMLVGGCRGVTRCSLQCSRAVRCLTCRAVFAPQLHAAAADGGGLHEGAAARARAPAADAAERAASHGRDRLAAAPPACGAQPHLLPARLAASERAAIRCSIAGCNPHEQCTDVATAVGSFSPVARSRCPAM
jgi:hypothetical protein